MCWQQPIGQPLSVFRLFTYSLVYKYLDSERLLGIVPLSTSMVNLKKQDNEIIPYKGIRGIINRQCLQGLSSCMFPWHAATVTYCNCLVLWSIKQILKKTRQKEDGGRGKEKKSKTLLMPGLLLVSGEKEVYSRSCPKIYRISKIHLTDLNVRKQCCGQEHCNILWRENTALSKVLNQGRISQG